MRVGTLKEPVAVAVAVSEVITVIVIQSIGFEYIECSKTGKFQWLILPSTPSI